MKVLALLLLLVKVVCGKEWEEEYFSAQLNRAMDLGTSTLEGLKRDATWNDTFAIANMVSTLTANATKYILSVLGDGLVRRTDRWDCTFVETRDVETKGPRKIVEVKANTRDSETTTTEEVWTTKEEVWKVSHEVTFDEEDSRLATFFGEKIIVKDKDDECDDFKTTSSVVDLDIRFDEINRTSARTPRRNLQVEGLFRALTDVGSIARDFRPIPSTVQSRMNDREDDVRLVVAKIFRIDATPDVVLPEFQRTFDAARKDIAALEDTPVHNYEVAFALQVLDQVLLPRYERAIDKLEDLLFSQLRSAIGKDLSSDDFRNFWHWHETTLFRSEYLPKPFSYYVRRSPTSFPDGHVSINDGREPIRTLQTTSSESQLWTVSLGVGGAECKVQCESHVHAYISRTFADDDVWKDLSIKASARQFSSYILLLGTVTDTFEPSHGIVVKNRDDIEIPLSLAALPTPKAFDDAIRSLSPEQQAFCTAYRKMQLSSSLFGLLIVEIEPNVEQVLNLDPGSLVKEIDMTDRLVDLFVDHSISTDLLKFDGPNDATNKLTAVKDRLSAVKAVFDKASDDDLLEEQRKAQFRKHQQDEEETWEFQAHSAPFQSENIVNLNGRRRLRSQASSSKKMNDVTSDLLSGDGEPFGEYDDEETPSSSSSSLQGLPQRLDAAYRQSEDDNLHPTKIHVESHWSRTSTGLLSKATTAGVNLSTEKSKAIDLLDPLSRSGALTLTSATLHVVVAATHAFDNTVVRTLVVDNIDPIAATEAATFLVASTLFDRAPNDLRL